MRKKGVSEVATTAIAVILVVVVIAIGAIIIYEVYLGPDAAPNWFMDIVNKYRYAKAFESLGEIQKEVNSMLSCTSSISSSDLKNQIENEVRNLPDDATYMFTRFNNLRLELEANEQFCKGENIFKTTIYSGDKDAFFSNLDSAKAEFEKVKKGATTAATRAGERVQKIDQIKKCSFDETYCTPKDSNNYCVWVEWNKPQCLPAVCSEVEDTIFTKIRSDEEEKIYCEVIEKETENICYANYDNGKFPNKVYDSCEECVSKCIEYKSYFPCTSNPCNVPGGCTNSIRGNTPMECRPKGDKCGMYDGDKVACENVDGCVFLNKIPDGREDVCLPCNDENVKCDNIMSPKDTIFGYTTQDFNQDCGAVHDRCSQDCVLRLRLSGSADEADKYIGDARKTAYYTDIPTGPCDSSSWDIFRSYCDEKRWTCCEEGECPETAR